MQAIRIIVIQSAEDELQIPELTTRDSTRLSESFLLDAALGEEIIDRREGSVDFVDHPSRRGNHPRTESSQLSNFPFARLNNVTESRRDILICDVTSVWSCGE